MEVITALLGPFPSRNGSLSLEPPRGFEPRTYALRERGFPINWLNFRHYSLDTFEGF